MAQLQVPSDIWLQVASHVKDNNDLQSILCCCHSANDLRDDTNLYALRLYRQHGPQVAIEKLAQHGLDSGITFLLGFGAVTVDDVRNTNIVLWTCKPRTITSDRMPGHEAVLRRGLEGARAASNIDPALWWACRNGHVSLIRILLQSGASPLTRRVESFVPLRMTDSVTIRSFAFDIIIATGPTCGMTALHIAIKYGHVSAVDMLLRSSSQRDALFAQTDDSGNNVLHLACKYPSPPIIGMIMSYDEYSEAVMKAPNRGGLIPLHVACLHGHSDVVDILLRNTSDASALLIASSLDGYLPIHLASMYKYPRIVKRLLDAATDSTCVIAQVQACHIQSMQTPLQYAAQEGDVETMSHILQATAAVGNMVLINAMFASNCHGNNAVHLCCQNGRLEGLTLLLQTARNAQTPGLLTHQLTSRNDNLAAPIHIACKFGYDRIAKLLLESAEDASQRNTMLTEPNRGGSSPLYLACKYGNIRVAQVLFDHMPTTIDKLAHLTAKKVRGFTPLHAACRFGNEQIVAAILDSMPDPIHKQGILMTRMDDGTTPLLMACLCSKQNVIDCILREAPDPRALVEQMRVSAAHAELPFHWATKRNYVSIVQAIARSASAIDNDALMQLLLMRDARGQTALHFACSSGRIEMVKVLLSLAPNDELRWRMMMAKDNDGQSPIESAEKNNHDEVVDLLKQDELYAPDQPSCSDVSSEVSDDEMM